MPSQAENRALQPYQESVLARIEPTSLSLQETRERKRFFLPADVLISRYGIIGFLLVDTRPEQRWLTYTDAEWIGVPCTEGSVPYGSEEDRVRRSHFIDTDTGFKMVRYFVLPPKVSEFFNRDKFLGDPFIDKCCREGTLPEEFDEIPADPAWAFGTAASFRENLELFVNDIVQGANPQASQDEIEQYFRIGNHRTYVSFHAWQDSKEVFSEGERSLAAALGNFDSVLERFDREGIHREKLHEGEASSNLPALNQDQT